MIDKYTKELERALNPREWDKELNEAWHKNIPDLQKAFDAIKNIAIKRSEVKMKHTIEIEGLPENIEIESAEINTRISSVYDGMSIGVILKTKLKKKQPRRIVLEETDEDIQTGCGKLMDQIICCQNDMIMRLKKPKKYWRIVEDNGEKNGD